MSQQSQYAEKKNYSERNAQQNISESNLKRDYYQPQQQQYSSKDDTQPMMKLGYQKQRSQNNNNSGQYYQPAQQHNSQGTNNTVQQFRNEGQRDNDTSNNNNSYQNRRKNGNNFTGNNGSYVPPNQGNYQQQGGFQNQRQQTQSSYQQGVSSSSSSNSYTSRQDSRNYTNNVYVPLNNNQGNNNNSNDQNKKNESYASNMNGNNFNSQQNGNYAQNNYQQQGKYKNNNNNGSNGNPKGGRYQQFQYVAQNQTGSKPMQNQVGQISLSSQSSQEKDLKEGQEVKDTVILRNHESFDDCDAERNQKESEQCLSQDELVEQDQQRLEDVNGIIDNKTMKGLIEKKKEGEGQVGLNNLVEGSQQFEENQGERQNQEEVQIDNTKDYNNVISQNDQTDKVIKQEEEKQENGQNLQQEDVENSINNNENQEQQIQQEVINSENEQDNQQVNEDNLEDYDLIEFGSEWVIWMCFSAEQNNYSNGLQDEKSFLQNNQALLSFKTLRELGLILSNSRFGQLSDFFTFRQTPKFQFSAKEDSPYRYIDAICFFKKGIKPIWEDDCNSYGQDIQAKFTKATVEQIDDIYCFFISNVFSEEFPFHAAMNGFRFVDKGKNTKKSGVRLEIWFEAISKQLANDIYYYFKDLLDQKWVNTVLKWEEHNKKVVQTNYHSSKYY